MIDGESTGFYLHQVSAPSEKYLLIHIIIAWSRMSEFATGVHVCCGTWNHKLGLYLVEFHLGGRVMAILEYFVGRKGKTWMMGSYRIAGNFRGIQFLQKGPQQRSPDLIFADGCSRIENVWLGFYYVDLIFVVCQSTAKTAIGSFEYFRPYGTCIYTVNVIYGR